MSGPIRIHLYRMKSGKVPFAEWLRGLKDAQTRNFIRNRVDRLCYGNPGSIRFVGNGVCEIKIFLGPGYRVYFYRISSGEYLLLSGGDKSTQRSDILQAQFYLEDYRRRRGK